MVDWKDRHINDPRNSVQDKVNIATYSTLKELYEVMGTTEREVPERCLTWDDAKDLIKFLYEKMK